LLNIDRVIDEILHVGLYNLVLQDIQKIAKKEDLTKEEVEKILKDNPQILKDYLQTNVEYNLSNIHIKDIDTNRIEDSVKNIADKINKNLKILREIEKYTLDFAQSSTLVLIFSVEFFVLFSVQYFIVLLDLKEWQWWIYSFFALSIVAAWIYAKKEQKKYQENNEKFQRIYKETVTLLNELEDSGYICRKDLYIESCDEHI